MQSDGARTHMLELLKRPSAHRILPAKVFQFREKLVLPRMFYAAPPLGGYVGVYNYFCK